GRRLVLAYLNYAGFEHQITRQMLELPLAADIHAGTVLYIISYWPPMYIFANSMRTPPTMLAEAFPEKETALLLIRSMKLRVAAPSTPPSSMAATTSSTA